MSAIAQWHSSHSASFGMVASDPARNARSTARAWPASPAASSSRAGPAQYIAGTAGSSRSSSAGVSSGIVPGVPRSRCACMRRVKAISSALTLPARRADLLGRGGLIQREVRVAVQQRPHAAPDLGQPPVARDG